MTKYLITNKLDPKEWENFISSQGDNSLFQSPAIYKLFSVTKNHTPYTFAVQCQTGKLKGLLLALNQKESKGPMGIFSTRTIIWGGPVIDSKSEPNERLIICQHLLNALLTKLKGKTIYIQFRNLFDLSQYSDVFAKMGFTHYDHLNYHVKTSKNKFSLKNISKSKQRQIKKSLRGGARIIEPTSIKHVEEFYKLLKDHYQQKIKKPLPDWSFFKEFYLISLEEDLGKYFLIEYKNQIIGGIMCPIFKDQIIYEWYICGLDKLYTGIYPSVLATWAPIDYAINHNLKYFDFMGAGKPDENYGVREFKSKFGGEQTNFGRFQKINNKFLYSLGRIGIKVLGILK